MYPDCSTPRFPLGWRLPNWPTCNVRRAPENPGSAGRCPEHVRVPEFEFCPQRKGFVSEDRMETLFGANSSSASVLVCGFPMIMYLLRHKPRYIKWRLGLHMSDEVLSPVHVLAYRMSKSHKRVHRPHRSAGCNRFTQHHTQCDLHNKALR